MKFHRKVTTRYLKSRRGFISVVTSFSLTGIALGVAALIVVMAVMAGFKEELLSRILGMTGHSTITLYQTTFNDALTQKSKLLQIEGIISAQPFIQGQAMAVRNGRASGVVVRGIDYNDKLGQELLFDSIIDGNIASLSQPNSVIIGTEMAKQMGLSIGGYIDLLSPQGTPTIAGFIPRMKRFRVVGIFDVGMYLYNTSWVYLSINNASKFFKTKGLLTAFEVKTEDPENIEKFTVAIGNIIPPPSRFITWKQNNQQFFEALQVEKIAMFLILSLVVIIAAFNIITGQTMLVNDKRADIAILRTMGAKRSDIMRIFLAGGGILGIIGTAIGLGLGLLIIHYLHPIVSFLETITGAAIFSGEGYFLTELPSVILFEDVMMVVILSLFLSFAASFYPAWRAARLDPVEVLRSE